MAFTQADLIAMEQRLSKNKLNSKTVAGHLLEAMDAVPEGQEGKLQASILEYLNAQKLAIMHSPMHRKTSVTKGCPDFVVWAPGGRLIAFECKTRTGKLDDDQKLFHMRAEREGHTIPIVRSMREFLKLM